MTSKRALLDEIDGLERRLDSRQREAEYMRGRVRDGNDRMAEYDEALALLAPELHERYRSELTGRIDLTRMHRDAMRIREYEATNEALAFKEGLEW